MTADTTSVALGAHPQKGDLLAIAALGGVRVVTVPEGVELPTSVDPKTVVVTVALGHVRDLDVLVTGSQGGSVAVWALESADRIAVLTLDRPITDVWVVRGADQVAARTDDGQLFIFDVVGTVDTAVR